MCQNPMLNFRKFRFQVIPSGIGYRENPVHAMEGPFLQWEVCVVDSRRVNVTSMGKRDGLDFGVAFGEQGCNRCWTVCPICDNDVIL